MPKQVLSAAVDAAATEAEWDALMEAVENDPAIKAEWSRIWEMRDARDGVALAGSSDFCSGVMAAIASEKPLPSTVVQMPARAATRPAAVARSWRTLVPLSAAAGVVAAVLVVGGYRGLSTENALPQQTASNPAPLVTTPMVLADEGRAAILNDYIVEHSNLLTERNMGGTFASARLVVRTNYSSDAR
ncbi:MAG: RseA family anti-sigma factor [Pseudomonadota bacterium]